MPMSEVNMLWEKPLDCTEIVGELGDCDESVLLHKVDGTPEEKIWDNLVRDYHYLSYGSMIGGRVKYLITLGTRLIGAISYCSASYKLGPRDLFVGWDEKARLEYLPHLINNNRFLILPWIKIKNLASHILSLSLKQIREDWKVQYAAEPFMAETFVDRAMFSGACYVAANWTYLGTTKGFGRIGNSFEFHGKKKDIFVNVMSRSFNQMFRPDIRRLPNEREENLNLITNIPIRYERILDKIGISGIANEKLNGLLADHVMRYTQYLGRKEHRQHFIAILKGLLSDLDRKSCGNIARAFEGGTEIRNIINFLTISSFDDDGMLEEYAKDLGDLLSSSEGMVTGDIYDSIRLGNKSVGVSRQFCPRIGRMRNCQSSVMLGYSGVEGSGLLDYSLYLPKKWFENEYQELKERCRVPKNIDYMTKSQLMLMMIDKAMDTGTIGCKYIGVDSSLGDDHAFLDSIPEGLVYFAEISNTNRVFVVNSASNISVGSRNLSTLIERREIHVAKVKDVIAESLSPWRSVIHESDDEFSNIIMDKCVKVIEFRKGIPTRDIWLYAMRFNDDSIKYALCNEPKSSSPEVLRALAKKRLNVRHCFAECRELLGIEQNEVRSWVGWRRHILLTLIAHLYIVKIRCLPKDKLKDD